jgi:eukaryotic-like serine/threonine-protein kinase
MATETNRVKDIFLAAVEHVDEASRAAYLDKACEGDADVRGRVEALLLAHDQSGSLLPDPAPMEHPARRSSN